MSEVEDLLKDIEKVRDRLQKLISVKHNNLTDEDVVATSKMLNTLLNQYNEFLDKKMK